MQEIYEKLYKDCVKLRKLNQAHIEKIDLCKCENEGLQDKLNEAISLTDKLQMKNATLEDKLRTQESEMILLNDRLKNFSTKKKKLTKS